MSPPANLPRNHNRSRIVVVIGCGLLAAFCYPPAANSPQPLVVYCAHDSLYSDAILERFRRQTGIPVAVVHDTEATKSLGLVNRLIRERDHPRCDVFWNNQVLGTMELKQRGLLVPYKGPGYKRIPSRYRDPDGCWTGFAARLRVYIVNTRRMPATEEAVQKAFTGNLLRVGVAKPLYGTTLSHYSVLWDVWRPDRLKQWHRDLREGGLRELPGNAAVMSLVAAGTLDCGWTDTDDFYVAHDRGDPVAMVPVTVVGDRVILIPNSVAIIRGTKHRSAAEQLVDFLLSADIETALARSKSRQIPLGPVEASQLPAEVRRFSRYVPRGVDLSRLGPARRACLDWLKREMRP